jgi:hypothetical protein
MRPFIITSLLAIAVVAIPLVLDLECKQLQKRTTDEVAANVVKALIAFGAFLWGGGIIARRAVNYYFVKLEEVEKEQLKNHMMAAARMQAKIRPQPLEATLIDMSGRM